MKTSGHLILYISENEDFELWRALAQLSPEERASFVKSALKRALAQSNDALINNARDKHNNYNLRSEKSAAESLLPDLTLEDLSFRDQVLDENVFKPLQYLNNETKNGMREIDKLERDTREREENHLGLINLNQLETKVGSDSVNKGLSFLLNNVIGEEDDEKVIEFIRKAKSQ